MLTWKVGDDDIFQFSQFDSGFECEIRQHSREKSGYIAPSVRSSAMAFTISTKRLRSNCSNFGNCTTLKK